MSTLGPDYRGGAGVRGYITVERFGPRMVWQVLESGADAGQTLSPDGMVLSPVFPELWRDVAAFWAEDDAKMLAALNAGLASQDHRNFVARLRAAVK